MVKRETVEEHQGFEESAGGVAVESPEGSAERVRDMEIDPIFLTDYGPGGEAIDAPVDTSRVAQAELPGMPDDVWPRFEGYRITEIALGFEGTLDLLSTQPNRVLAARIAHLNEEVDLLISGRITGRKFRLNRDKNGITTGLKGSATMLVEDVSLAGGAFDDDEGEAAIYTLTLLRARLVRLLADVELGEAFDIAARLSGMIAQLEAPADDEDGTDFAPSGDAEESEPEGPGVLDAALAEAMA